MRKSGDHPVHEVSEHPFFHFVSVEAEGIFIEIGLQVADRKVNASKSSFKKNFTAVQLWEILAFFL